LRCWLEELSQSDAGTHKLVWWRHVEGIKPAKLAERTGQDAHRISDRINQALNKFRAWLVGEEKSGLAIAPPQ